VSNLLHQCTHIADRFGHSGMSLIALLGAGTLFNLVLCCREGWTDHYAAVPAGTGDFASKRVTVSEHCAPFETQ
jgi:hypothetical protein